MLTKSSIQAAYPVAVNLAARGLLIDAKRDSPLAQLTSTVLSQALEMHRPGNENIEPTASFAVALQDASTTAIAGGQVPHDVVHATIVSNGVKGVRASLALAQGVVAPLIKKSVLEIETAVDQATAKAGKPLSVVPFYYKDIWDDGALLSMCERYEGRPATLQLRPLGIPVPANWTAALSTGVPSLDDVVVKFVSDSNPAFLAQVWQELFAANVTTLEQVVNTQGFDKTDAVIVAYLAARNLQDNIPAGLNISLDAWRLYMADLVSAAGAQLMLQIKRRQQTGNSGRLILTAPGGDTGTILVFGDNYDQFLNAGGSPEAIMGAHLLRRHGELRVGASAEQIGMFADNWKRAHAVILQRVAYERQDLILRSAAAVLSAAIGQLPEPRVVGADVMQERLRALIRDTEGVETKNLWALVRKLVCRSMFAHTDVERILRGVDDVAADNMNVREAAFLATADYVVEWLLSQVEIRRVLGG